MRRGGAGREYPLALLTGLFLTETVSWGVLYYAFGVFVTPMREELGWSAAETAAGFTIALTASALAGIPIGRWVDRHGARRLMTIGSAWGAFLLAAWSQVSTLWSFYLVWALIGVAMAAVLYEPAFAVLAKRTDRRSLASALSVLGLAGSVGSFIFLPLSAWLIEGHGWRGALLLLACAVCGTAPIHAIALKARETIAPAGEAITPPSRPLGLHMLTLAVALGAGTSAALSVHLVPLLLEAGHTTAFVAMVGGLTGIALVPGRAVFPLLSSALPPAPLAASGLGLMCAGTLLLLASASPAAAVASAVVFGLGNSFKTLVLATAIRDWYGGDAYGTVSGLSAAAVKGAQAGAPLVAGLVYGVCGDYELVIALLVAATALGAAAAGRASGEAAARAANRPLAGRVRRRAVKP